MTAGRLVSRGLAVALLVAIVAGALQPRLIRMTATLNPEMRARLSLAADAQYPSYPHFLETVRAATSRGDTIAIAFPASGWDSGYSYAYYRASYLLAGREVLPLMTPQGVPIEENLTRARYVAVFHSRLQGGPLHVIVSTDDGALIQR